MFQILQCNYNRLCLFHVTATSNDVTIELQEELVPNRNLLSRSGVRDGADRTRQPHPPSVRMEQAATVAGFGRYGAQWDVLWGSADDDFQQYANCCQVRLCGDPTPMNKYVCPDRPVNVLLSRNEHHISRS